MRRSPKPKGSLSQALAGLNPVISANASPSIRAYSVTPFHKERPISFINQRSDVLKTHRRAAYLFQARKQESGLKGPLLSLLATDALVAGIQDLVSRIANSS